jgi:D-alanyl-D-alanine carboxypeptidase
MAAPTQRTPQPYVLQALNAIAPWLAYKQQYDRIPGLAVGISYHDQIIFTGAYGYSDVLAKTKVTPETRFRIASISKVFTATAIMQLAERSALYLDMPVASYLPWFADRDDDSSLATITIRHLLSHLAGITRDGSTQHWSNDVFPTPAQIETQMGDGVGVFAPLQRFKYSNFGYTILGRVLEAVSGQPYAEYINQNIFTPIGLSATSCDFVPALEVNLAKGYGRELPGSLAREEFLETQAAAMTPAAGIIADVSDLCRFMAALRIGSGKLLSDQNKREMQIILSSEQYGLGLQVVTLDGHQILTHIGIFTGFTSRIALDSEENLNLAVFANANEVNVDALTYGILQTIWYFRQNQDVYKSRAPGDQSLNDYVGLYRGRWSNVQIERIGERLFGFNPKFDNPLLAKYVLDKQGNDRFLISDCDGYDYVGESIQFRRDDQRKVSGMGIGPYPLTRIALEESVPDATLGD